MLLVYCLMYFSLFVGVLCLSLSWYALLCVLFKFAIILKRKRELVALLLIVLRMSCYCKCFVALLHGAVGWSAVCVFVVFPDHIHLLFVAELERW